MTKIKKGDFVSMIPCKIAEKYKGEVWEVSSDPWLLLDTVEVAQLKGYQGNTFSGFPISHLQRELKSKEA